MERKLIYIACPFSDSNKEKMELRNSIATTYCAKLVADGVLGAFSPISYSDPLAKIEQLPRSWNYWGEVDRMFLSYSKKMIVLTLEGWKESEGVQAEIEIATEMGIPIEYVDPLEDM